MIRKILILLVALVFVLIIVIATRPTDFHVERSKLIPAPPAAIFPHVNDLHLWQEWSPWAKVDPAAKATFEGPPAGKGAIFHWAGNSEVGEGTMSITESHPDEFVKFQLDFRKPFEGTNTADIELTPEGSSTRVTWSMDGKNNFMAKAIGLVIDCDKMIGDQFDKGLNDLSKIATSEKTNP